MRKINLGKTGFTIAPLIFGGNVFGWTINEKTSFELLDEFYANGFNCIDTADVYSFWHDGNKGGESETIIGNWLKKTGKRNEMIIATKAGYAFANGKNNLSRAHILKSVDLSLKRLQTDYIDLYQAHIDDETTPLKESLETFNELIKLGKVRAIGCSNYKQERIAEALKISKTNNFASYQTCQPEYNLCERENYENKLQNFCVENELAVIPFFPLAAGFLSGKYTAEKDAVGKAREARVKKYLNPKGFKIIAALEGVAKEYNATPAEISLAWISAQLGIAAPIASATNLSQLKSLMKSVSIKLSESAIKTLNIASR